MLASAATVPLDDALLLAVKHGVVELTVPVSAPETDTAEEFGAAVQALLHEHQYQIMTDPTILDPDELEVATCLESRDPLPDGLQNVLLSLGFTPQASETGGEQQRSLFSRFQKRQRAKLDRWRLSYGRARDSSAELAEFEACLMEEVPDGDLWLVAEAASDVVVRAARTYLRLLLAPGLDGLAALERRILDARGATRGRWVLQPAAVRGLAAFTGESARAEAPDTRWVEDEEEPLWVHTRAGATLRSDPEYRVVSFVGRGSRALLSSYLRLVLTQTA